MSLKPIVQIYVKLGGSTERRAENTIIHLSPVAGAVCFWSIQQNIRMKEQAKR